MPMAAAGNCTLKLYLTEHIYLILATSNFFLLPMFKKQHKGVIIYDEKLSAFNQGTFTFKEFSRSKEYGTEYVSLNGDYVEN